MQRRLQHFIDRKINALFEPLMAVKNDEALTGLARGFAFQLVEALGILSRADVADEIKRWIRMRVRCCRRSGLVNSPFHALLLKPAPTFAFVTLWASRGWMFYGLPQFGDGSVDANAPQVLIVYRAIAMQVRGNPHCVGTFVDLLHYPDSMWWIDHRRYVVDYGHDA